MGYDHHYGNHYGHRAPADWDAKESPLSPWAEGDVVRIREDAVVFQKGIIPHSWSTRPDLGKPGKYRVVSVYTTQCGWCFRVCPIIEGKTIWDETSDRCHQLVDDSINVTSDWELLEMAKPRRNYECCAT